MASSSPLSSDIEGVEKDQELDYEVKEQYNSSPLLEADEEDEEPYEGRLLRTRKPNSKSKKNIKKAKKSKKKRSSPSPELELELEAEIDNLTRALSKPPISDDGLSSDAEMETNLKNLTRRQKAKYLDEYDEELLELPVDSKKKLYTEEETALRKSETARKRKHQSQQKAERDKMDTINRLLKKQANKKSRADQRKEFDLDNENDQALPTELCYKMDNQGNTTLSFPIGLEHLVTQFTKKSNYPPELSICMVKGCNNFKKYQHPKNLKFSCSLDHFKQLLP